MTARVNQDFNDNIGPAAASTLYPLSGDADVALRTGDGVLFGLHRALLRRASPVMGGMLLLGGAKPDIGNQPGEHCYLATLKLKLIVGNSHPVRIQEDSKTLEDLLSYIYPDRQIIVFEELDAFLNVLKAAARYQMAVVVSTLTEQVTSPRLKGSVTHQPLMYKDPLRVFATAKHLAIERLSLITREATLTIDIHSKTTRSTEASTMSALWLWELEDTRRERWEWLKDRCEAIPYISSLFSNYHHVFAFLGGTVYNTSSLVFSRLTCPLHDNKVALARLLERIKEFPCPKSIREIDFHSELNCSRCGDASTAFFKRICEDYEAKFGIV
jgi:hypothetical protein